METKEETKDDIRLKLAELGREISDLDKNPVHQGWLKIKEPLFRYVKPWVAPVGTLVGGLVVGSMPVVTGAELAWGLAGAAGMVGGILWAASMAGYIDKEMEKADRIPFEPSRASRKLVRETMKTGSPQLQALLKIACEDKRKQTLDQKIFLAGERVDGDLRDNIAKGDAKKVREAITAGAKLENLPWQHVTSPEVGEILVENAPDQELEEAKKYERNRPFVSRERLRRKIRQKPEAGLEI
jgi:hypothetical protein